VQSKMWMPRPHTESDLDVLIWMEPKFHKASNGIKPTSKFHLSQQESSKQVHIQNLSGCSVTIFWAVGPCIVLEPVRVASRGLARL
jgi:hypothetical protein